MALVAIVAKRSKPAGKPYGPSRAFITLIRDRPRLGLRQRPAQNPKAIVESPNDRHRPAFTSPHSVGYLGEESYLGNPSVPPHIDDAAAETAEWQSKVLQVTDATVLPSKVMIEALADVYFGQVHPHQPIVDRADIAETHPSPLLVQSLCLIGSSFGHRRASTSQIKSANPFYLKVKTLLAADHEKDNLLVLKALCLLTCRSVTLPTHICLDSNWYWQGVAVRYATHMGLHKEASYAGKESPGSCRRLWWHLYVSQP